MFLRKKRTLTVRFNSFHDGVPYHVETSIGFLHKSIDWFLYDRDLRNERVSLLILVLQVMSNSLGRYGFMILLYFGHQCLS